MSIAGQLDDLRASISSCSLVVFGDLSSQITLCVSAREKQPQEQLDALCVAAANLLDSAASQSASAALEMSCAETLNQAIVLGPTGMQVFQRSQVDDADVLACVCSLNADVELVAAQLRSTLSQIAEVQ